MARLETVRLPAGYDALAPDGSEIRKCPDLKGGGMAHCTLLPHSTSLPVRHRTVEEIWYFISGTGQVWRRLEGAETIVDAAPGTSVTIPLGTEFQFRNTGADPLCFVIVTMPPWPGADEAIRVEHGHWAVKG